VDRAEYCIKRCGGRCCSIIVPNLGPVRCPKQAEDGSCSIYHHRYREGAPAVEKVGTYRTGQVSKRGLPIFRPFYCGRIEDVIARGALPEEIAARCCYVHPELLEDAERN